MKKVLIIAALVSIGGMVYGQGHVTFANSSTTLAATEANLTGGGVVSNVFPAATFTFGLFVGPGTSTTFAALTGGTNLPVATAANSGLAGRFAGGNVTLPAPFDGSAAVNFIVLGWDNALGANWGAIRSAVDWTGTGNATWNFSAGAPAAGTHFLGASSIGFFTPSTGIATPPNIFGVAAGQVPGFHLMEVAVPEPSTIALGVLGLIGMLVIRRRK